jgi:hypothetical protein
MKKLAVAVCIVCMAAPVVQADNIGSSFGALMTAQSVAQGHYVLGGRLGVAEATSFYGTFGYGFSRNADGRIKLGFVGDDLTEGELVLGADTKWQVWKVYQANSEGQVSRTKHPFDLAVGPFVEWFKVDVGTSAASSSVTATQLGLQVVGSYPVQLKNGSSIAPYGRINVRNEWLSFETSVPGFASVSGSESQLALGLNGGVSWRPRASAVALFGEIQIDGNNGVFFGLDYLIK